MTKSAKKTVADTRTVMNRLVMPGDANTFGTLMGGHLLNWMDMCAAIAARRHSNSYAMTVSIDRVQFISSIALGEVVIIEAEVTRAFRKSMEVAVKVTAENLKSSDKRLVTATFFTFAAVDADGATIPVPEIIPETSARKIRYEEAGGRRDQRLKDSGLFKKAAEPFSAEDEGAD